MTDNNKKTRDPPLSILSHIAELRSRLWRSAVTALVGFGLGLGFYRPIFKMLTNPAHGHLSPYAKPIVTSPTEFMGMQINIALICALVFALPVLLYQLIKFIAPAISPKSERMLLLFMPLTIILFVGGMTVSYVIVLPTMFKFLLNYGSDLVTPMIRLQDYINIELMLLAGMGLAFETPLVMYLLAKIGIVSYKAFWHFEKWVILLAFVIGAIFDPSPNPLDQIVVAGTIILLYQVGVLLAWMVRRREEAARI